MFFGRNKPKSTDQQGPSERPKGKWRNRIGALLIAGTTLSIAESVQDSVDNVVFTEEVKDDIQTYTQKVKQRYGVEIDLVTADGETENYRYVDARNMLKWTLDVLGFYPDELIKDQLRLITLGGAPEGFLGQFNQGTVTIDLRGKFPRVIEEHAFKSILVHELQHFFDYVDEGDKAKPDALAWEGLNPPGGTYDLGQYGSTKYPLLTDIDEPDGFVFGYQKRNIYEDRGVVAQLLFLPTIVEGAAARLDPHMQKKIDSLRSFYSAISKGKMNAGFWKDFHNGKVGSSYWAQCRED